MRYTIAISNAPPRTTTEIPIVFQFGQEAAVANGPWGVRVKNVPGVQGDIVGSVERILQKDGVRVFAGLVDDPSSWLRLQGLAVQMAVWHRHMGDFTEARRLLEGALANGGPNPWTRAMLLLQIGAIDLQTGKWQAAEARFAEADRAFPGWWLAKAHLGQMAAVRGDFVRAEALYGEAMQGAAGRKQEATALSAKARALWLERVGSHPAAYADHAFDAVLAELERTGWRSTEQYRVLAEVCERLGDTDCAQACCSSAITKGR